MKHIHHRVISKVKVATSSKYRAMFFAAVFAVIGVIALLSSFAATSSDTRVLEAESASLSGQLALKSDIEASGGSYVEFGVPEAPVAASWQEAWDSRDYATIQNWYRNNTGIAAAGLNDSDLTPSGSFSTTADNQIIENLLVQGSISVEHDNVTIRNTKIIRSGNYQAIGVPYGKRDTVNRFVVENVSLIGTPAETYTQALKATYATVEARFVYITGFGGGIFISNDDGDIIEYCMVEDIKIHLGSHNTGMSTRGGDNKTIYRNWIEGSTSSALSYYPDSKPIRYSTAKENLFDGGSYSILGGDGKIYGPQSTYNKFIDNLFTRNYKFGPLAVFDRSIEGREWSGNYHLDGVLIP